MKEEVCVKISGMNLTRIIDKLIAKNILIKDLKSNSKYIKFVISSSDLTELNKICKIEHKYYEIIYKNGFRQVLSKVPYLLGVFLSIVIILSYFISINSYVFDVNVTYSSNLNYDINNVNKFLFDKGIVTGMKRNKYSTREIQQMILVNFDDVSGCSVKIVGGKLNIVVYPATKQEVVVSDIISKHDAVITKINVFAGESEFKVGDIVKAGDLLIKNTNGASGEIEGKVYYNASIIYNENQQYLERTGNKYVVRNIVLFNKLKLNHGKKPIFNNFETEICDFYLYDQYLVPIKIQEITYYEMSVKERIVPFKDVEDKILNDAYNDALRKVEDITKISNVTYSIVTEENYTRVDCFIETIINLF